MEELRETALAYYANLSANEKKQAVDFFNRMDADGDGKVSSSELRALRPRLHPLFKELDNDGNGTLDFEEFKTVYYIVVSGRMVYCDGCAGFLKGVYFTCSQCFNPTEHNSFDLCCACYRERKFTHHNAAIFYDNFTLLRSEKFVQYLQNQMTSVSPNSTSNQEEGRPALATASQVLAIGNSTFGIGKKIYDITNDMGQQSGNDDEGCSIM